MNHLLTLTLKDEIEELETAEEKLTPAPAIEYETSLLSDDDERD